MTFVPTKLRGAQLARHILELIEQEAHVDPATGRPDPQLKGNIWNQSTWASFHLKHLKPNTMVEVLDHNAVSEYPDEYDYLEAGGGLVAAEPGISCGTAMCFAGHATFLAGDRFVIGLDHLPGDGTPGIHKNIKRVSDGRTVLNVSEVLVNNDHTEEIDERARELLGLDSVEANMMFATLNDLRDLRKYVEDMEAGLHLRTRKPKTGNEERDYETGEDD